MEKLSEEDYLEGWQERMDKFIEGVRPIYEAIPMRGIAGVRIPNAEQEKRIREILRKWAKNKAEEGRFREQARQVWEAW